MPLRQSITLLLALFSLVWLSARLHAAQAAPTASDTPSTPAQTEAPQATPAAGTPRSQPTATDSAPAAQGPPATGATAAEPAEVLVEAVEPKYVAPTLRDRIGRIWAPVLINGKGPYRLVLDTGASHSAILDRVAVSLGITPKPEDEVLVRGVTGSSVVPAIHVDRMEVGDLLIAPTTLPIVADVFGGAEGVLGREGLPEKRILADFGHDRLTITHSHRERAPPGFTTIPLKLVSGGLLAADVMVGYVRAQAIIDTGGQASIGNLALRRALSGHPPKGIKPDEIMGVTLDLQKGDSITAPPVRIGKLEIDQVRVTFADTYLFQHLKLTREPTILLGMDVLGTFDVMIIDYRLHELQIRMRSGNRR